MERLTFKNEEMTDGIKCPVKNDYYIDEFCDKVCSIFQHDCPFMNMGKKLKSYEDAEENGLLIHLPCRVGDKVYRIWTCGKNGRSIAEFKIEHIDIDNYPEIEFSYRCTKGSHNFYPYRFCKLEDFGKTVFITREEAENELERLKNNG